MPSLPADLSYVELLPGDAAPWFTQRCTANERFRFDSVAGRYILLCFFVSAAQPRGQAALAALAAHRALFDDSNIACFGVSLDPDDEAAGRVQQSLPGIRHFWDFDGSVHRLFGAMPQQPPEPGQPLLLRPMWVLLDPALRVMDRYIMSRPDAEAALFERLHALPPPDLHLGMPTPAPVLLLPNVFEPGLCRHLIGLYEADGGEDSGFMVVEDGRTVGRHDRRHKSRRDFEFADAALMEQTRLRMHRRVVPEIARVHNFVVTRMERYLVGCYAAEDNAHFAPHRDNTTPGTAHRRFAVSVMLNDDYEGGELRFPEYGSQGYRLAAGSAVVFSAGLLHSVRPVTRGRRYAFLPFLYDEAAARVREANIATLEGGSYKA